MRGHCIYTPTVSFGQNLIRIQNVEYSNPFPLSNSIRKFAAIKMNIAGLFLVHVL